MDVAWSRLGMWKMEQEQWQHHLEQVVLRQNLNTEEVCEWAISETDREREREI